jgi:hypothetical protein
MLYCKNCGCLILFGTQCEDCRGKPVPEKYRKKPEAKSPIEKLMQFEDPGVYHSDNASIFGQIGLLSTAAAFAISPGFFIIPAILIIPWFNSCRKSAACAGAPIALAMILSLTVGFIAFIPAILKRIGIRP